MYQKIYLQYNYVFPLLLAFLIPFKINISPLIGLWGVCFLFSGNFKANFSSVFQNKWSWILIGFFFLHAIGYIFSDNKTEALTAIEQKLAFLIFPLIIFSTKYSSDALKKITIS